MYVSKRAVVGLTTVSIANPNLKEHHLSKMLGMELMLQRKHVEQIKINNVGHVINDNGIIMSHQLI